MHGRADIGALRRRGSSSEPIPLRKVKNRRAGSSSNTPQSLLTCAPLGRPGIGAASDVDQYEPSCGPLQPLMAPQAPRGRTVHIFPAKLRRARPPSASSGVAVRTTEEARLRGRHPKKGVSYKCFNRVKETLHEAQCLHRSNPYDRGYYARMPAHCPNHNQTNTMQCAACNA